MVRLFLADRRRQTRDLDLHRLQAAGTAQPDPIGRSTSTVTVLEALATLAPRMRAVVVLRFWEDLSVEQTAAALGCSTGTVKSATSKVLAHLRDRPGDTFTDTTPSSTTRS